MNAGCDLTGKSENETLINQKRWLCGWSKRIIEKLQETKCSIDIIKNGIGYNSDANINVNTIKELLNAISNSIDNEFINDGYDILQSIKTSIQTFKDECNNQKPIPVYSYSDEKIRSSMGVTKDEIHTTSIITVNGGYHYFMNKNNHLCYNELCERIDNNFDEKIKKYILVFNFESKEKMDLFNTKTYTIFDNLEESDKRVTVSMFEAIRRRFKNIEIEFFYMPKTYVKYEPNENFENKKGLI